jgi:hypothetical protein
MSFVEPHQNHCQKNKESITQYRSQSVLKASTWQELLQDGEASFLLQRAVAPQ